MHIRDQTLLDKKKQVEDTLNEPTGTTFDPTQDNLNQSYAGNEQNNPGLSSKRKKTKKRWQYRQVKKAENSSNSAQSSISDFTYKAKNFLIADDVLDDECVIIVFHVHLPPGIQNVGEPVVIGNIEELGNWREVKVRLYQHTQSSYWYSNPIHIPFVGFQGTVKYKYAVHSKKGDKNHFQFEGYSESDDRVLESLYKNQFDIWKNNDDHYILNGRVNDYMFLEVIYNSVNPDNFKEAILEYDAILKAHRELTLSATNFEFISRRISEESLCKKFFLCFLLGHCRPNFVGSLKLPGSFQHVPLLRVIDDIQSDTFPSNNKCIVLKGIELLIHRDIERGSFVWLKIFPIVHHIDPQYKFIDAISFVGKDKYVDRFVEMLPDRVLPFIEDIDESIYLKISKWLISNCNNAKSFSIVWQLLIHSEEFDKQFYPYVVEGIKKIMFKRDSVDLHENFTETMFTEIMQTVNNQNDSLPRGRSLDKDFRQLINDERFYDIALECSDGVAIFGCKAILATRSDIFNKLIFTEFCVNSELSFNDINSTAMKIILEFLYTSKTENLTVNNVVEVYYATNYFGLVDLQDNILKFIKKSLKDENVDVGKKLLSECVKKFSLREDNKDNRMSRILVDWVAKSKLEKNETDSLSLDGLGYLLRMTFDSQIPFATPEFTIWEYALSKALRKVIQNRSLVEKILNEKSLSVCNPRDAERVKDHLALIQYIDLNRMDVEEIKQHVEPFNIFLSKQVMDAYRFKALGQELGFVRGVPIFKWKNVGSNNQLDISNDGFTVEAVKGFTQSKSILGDLIFKVKGVYEWDVLIEKLCGNIYIGICDINEDLNKTDQKYHGWVLGSDGYVYRKNVRSQYDAKFKEGDKVSVHLDMKMRTCAFSINMGNKKLVTEWKEISSQVYPIASLGHGSKLRVEPHTRN